MSQICILLHFEQWNNFSFNFFNLLFLVQAVLSLRCCKRLSLVAESQGSSLVSVAGFPLHEPLTAETRRGCVGFGSCGTWAQLPQGTWDLLKPGIDLLSPALQGGFSSTGPPSEAQYLFFYKVIYRVYFQSPRVHKIEAEQFGILVQLLAEMSTFVDNITFFCLLTYSNGIGHHNSGFPSGLFYITIFLLKK